MNLKAFHIVFITLSTLLCGFFSWWCYANYSQAQAAVWLAAMVAGALSFLALMVYGGWFFRKIKRLAL